MGKLDGKVALTGGGARGAASEIHMFGSVHAVWRAVSTRRLSALVVVTFMVACAPEYGMGFRSSDEEYMRQFISQLNQERISYAVAKDGTVKYKTRDELAVKEIHEMLRKKLASSNAVKYEEPEAREFLKNILQDKGLEFREEERKDGVWIKWYPESDAQKEEIQMQVVKYMIDLQAQGK